MHAPTPRAPAAGAPMRRQAGAMPGRGGNGGLHRALLITTGFLLAINYGRVHELYAITSGLPVGKILLPLGAILMVAQPDLSRRMRVLRTPQVRWYGLFLLAMMASIPFSLWKGGSFMDFKGYLMAVVPLLVITATSVRSLEDLLTLFRGVLLGVIPLAVALAGSGATMVQGRATASSTYDPNDAALAAVVALPLVIPLIMSRRVRDRVLAAVAAVACLAIVAVTSSRGGMLALGVVLIRLLLAGRPQIEVRWKAVILVAVVAGLSFAPSTFWTRLSSMTELGNDYNMTSESGRTKIWKRGLKYAAKRPITGVGLNQFGLADGTWGPRVSGDGLYGRWTAAHNMFIQVLTELGVFGLISYLGLFIPFLLGIRKLRRHRARAPDAESKRLLSVAFALETSMLAFFVGGFFLSAAYGAVTVTVLALSTCFMALVPKGAVVRRPALVRGAASFSHRQMPTVIRR